MKLHILFLLHVLMSMSIV